MSTPTDVEPAAGAGGAARNPTPPASPPALRPVELVRWAWRQLTSMRTALVLLFLLAVAAVPGSVVPQADIDALAVGQWKSDHPALTPVYEFLGLFSVYDSVWFSAIYILLMVSLVGCIVPRLRIYWRGMRARPPQAPRHLSRLPESRSFEVDGAPQDVLARAEAVLRRRRYRTEASPPGPPAAGDAGSVAGERGYLREAGNLLFHVSVLVVLVGFAVGQLYGYKGGVVTVVGQGFSNSLSQYDDFAPGSMFSVDDLAPVSLTVDDFDVSFLTAGPQMGQPRDFSADVTYTERPGAEPRRYDLRVNHPLKLDGVSIFLVGHGYAPVVTVRDGNGDVAYEGPVVFLPQDASFASFGVLKVPDAAPEQLGFEGLFLPTYGFTMERGPFSQFPDDLDPVLSLVPYRGDLGLDTGAPQSVYNLDKDGLVPFDSADASRGSAARIKLSVGDTVDLPEGAGSITFDRVDRWTKLQVSDTPGKGLALGGVLLGILGLMGSLFIRPRRAWVRVRAGDRPGRTVVELAGLDRSSGGELGSEIDELQRADLRPTARDLPGDQDMSTADLAAFSNNAVMFASIVYVLAFVAHVTEWAAGRTARAVDPAEELVGAGPRAGAPAPAVSTAGVADEERVERWGRIGVSLTVVAALLHLAALVTRGLGSDPVRVPWGNMYEFTLAGAFGVSLMYLLLGRRHGLRWMGLPVTGFQVVVLMLAALFLYVPAGPLVPALDSYWLVIHVMAAVVASGAFAVGAIAAVLFLVKDRARSRGTLRPGGYLDRLPDLPALDRVSYRLHAFGFPIWTFAALVAGPIWAEYAWGRYWNWDPKEVWAFITWVVYAAYLHARATAGWRGRAAAVIALVGFASLLFNFVGINFFFGSGSLHSYAG